MKKDDEKPPGLEPMLTVRDVAAVTRLSRAQVYKLINRGVLPHTRLPGCTRNNILIDPSDLRAFLEAGKAAPVGACS